ncbi:hypothetical protein [Streptomyces anulatus]|uniref:hypothetical protein n=1 Tax=Streptomyces anulatus TaxID=1892 RepID=UPI0036BD6D1F
MAARSKSTPPAEPQEPDVAAEGEAPAEDASTSVGDAYVEALRREREGYARYGRKDRAAEVDAELKRLGVPLERAVPAPRETA